MTNNTAEINKKNTWNFNKEILFGEIGSLISAPMISYIVSNLTSNLRLVSLSAVLGAIVGGSLFWLLMRIHDKRKQYDRSMENLGNDILYFTPAAFFLTSLVYYPTLYLVSYDFLTNQHRVLPSVVFSQFLAFGFFLAGMNLYRYLLARYKGKVL